MIFDFEMFSKFEEALSSQEINTGEESICLQ